MNASANLLVLTEFLPHNSFISVYRELGFNVVQEWTPRKASAQLRKVRPDILVADFYYQPDFRDRVSNLESLLATAQQAVPNPKTLVFYDPAHWHALEKVQHRFHIDAALTLPVDLPALRECLLGWR